jgi:hypothetical protein
MSGIDDRRVVEVLLEVLVLQQGELRGSVVPVRGALSKETGPRQVSKCMASSASRTSSRLSERAASTAAAMMVTSVKWVSAVSGGNEPYRFTYPSTNHRPIVVIPFHDGW